MWFKLSGSGLSFLTKRRYSRDSTESRRIRFLIMPPHNKPPHTPK